MNPTISGLQAHGFLHPVPTIDISGRGSFNRFCVKIKRVGFNTVALIFRIGFWGILCYTYNNKEPPK